MEILEIVKKPNKILTQKTREVKEITPEIKKLIRQMRMTMHKAQGVGLSANQAGYDLRIFVAQIDNKFYAVINPRITKQSREKIELEEGCLSIPKIFGPVSRPERIVLEGLNEQGKKIKIKANGLLARIFQHEFDHLNGHLFDEKADKLYRIEEISKNHE